jgi:hypothetical protein
MRPAFLAALLLLAACAGPKPCTRALCVTKLDGTMELMGWSGSVAANADSPKPPVLSDTTVTVRGGSAEFVNGKSRVIAADGASFQFSVSTRAIPSIQVFSGSVSVAPAKSTAAPVEIAPGAPYALPKP